jgi:hypothetical protein
LKLGDYSAVFSDRTYGQDPYGILAGILIFRILSRCDWTIATLDCSSFSAVLISFATLDRSCLPALLISFEPALLPGSPAVRAIREYQYYGRFSLRHGKDLRSVRHRIPSNGSF